VRIAVVNWSRRRVGGVEGYLADVIPALVAAGHDLIFWFEMDRPVDRNAIPLPDGVSAICADTRGTDAAIADLRAWKPDLLYLHVLDDPDVERKVLDIAPSVLFLHGYYGTCISGSKTFKRPVVTPCSRQFGWPCLVHYFPHGCGGRSPVTMIREYRRQTRRHAHLRRYDAIVTHSDHMAEELVRHGLSPRQVGFPVPDPAAPADHWTAPECWCLLFAGRMDRLKGGHVLLDALASVRVGLDRNLRLTFAGDGPERSSLERQARLLQGRVPGIEVAFAGWVERDRLGALMADADLLVVPSLWPEPFGAVGPMAGHHALPAVAFDVGGISQWLIDGVNGHLAAGDPPTADALAAVIRRCLTDPQELPKLRRGAVEMAGRFRMDAHLQALLGVFADVVAAGHECARSAAEQ
jgi:glycosyltransferase involved in cell wall biosynthesis